MPEVQENAATVQPAPQRSDERAEKDTARTSMAMMSIYVCAAIGGTIAAIADLVQKEQASAVLKMTTISARHLNLAVPPLYILLIVIGLGVLLCFVFQPGNRKAGFAVGAGVIASIMTVTPYQPIQSGQPSEPETADFQALPGTRGLELAPSDNTPFQIASNALDLAVIPIENDLAVPVEVKISFYDRNSRQAYEQVQAIAAGATRLFEFSAKPQNGRINAEFFLEVAGERSSYIGAAGAAPYHNPALPLTQAVPSFTQAQIDENALKSYLQNAGSTNRPASNSEVRAIYDKPTGVINKLQQRLLTPRKW